MQKVFLDTNFLIARIKEEDVFKQESFELFSSINSGKLAGFCSVVSLSECVFVLKKLGRENEIAKTITSLLSIDNLEFLPLTSSIFLKGVDYMDSFGLTLSDALIAATLVENGFEEIVSGDSDFDKLDFIKRIDPLKV